MTVTAKDRAGQAVDSVSLVPNTGKKGVITAAFITVPEGGTLTANGGNCMAELNDE